MTPELEALARRAVACKGWRWMAGMLACVDVPMPHFDGAVRLRVVADDEAWGGPVGAPIDALPDLTDPCTLGGLLALVREAHGSPLLRVEGFPDGWRTVRSDRAPYIVGLGPTEADALVAALEAAP